MKDPNGKKIKYKPGERKKILLELKHSNCDDKNRYCKMCFECHSKDEPCKMLFKKLSSQRSKICYVSYAVITGNFQIECHACYTYDKTCPIHSELQPIIKDDMCNALAIFRDVSIMKSHSHLMNSYLIDKHFQIKTFGDSVYVSKEYFWNFDIGLCHPEQMSLMEDENVQICPFPPQEKAKTHYNKDKKTRALDDIACVKPMDSMETFIQDALLDTTFANTIVIGHGRKFLPLVYKALLKMTIQPVALRKANGLIRLISNVNNIKFTSIDSYLPKDFKSIYEESEEAVLFPHCVNHPDLYQLTNLPKNYFRSIEDSNDMIKKKENFYLNFIETDQSLEALLHEYLQAELTFLSNLCLKIEETGEAFQMCLQTSEKLKELPIISVFSQITQTSFFYAILTNYTMRFHEGFELFTTMCPEKGIYSGRTSIREFRYQMYQKHIKPNNDLVGSYLTSKPLMLGKGILLQKYLFKFQTHLFRISQIFEQL